MKLLMENWRRFLKEESLCEARRRRTPYMPPPPSRGGSGSKSKPRTRGPGGFLSGNVPTKAASKLQKLFDMADIDLPAYAEVGAPVQDKASSDERLQHLASAAGKEEFLKLAKITDGKYRELKRNGKIEAYIKERGFSVGWAQKELDDYAVRLYNITPKDSNGVPYLSLDDVKKISGFVLIQPQGDYKEVADKLNSSLAAAIWKQKRAELAKKDAYDPATGRAGTGYSAIYDHWDNITYGDAKLKPQFAGIKFLRDKAGPFDISAVPKHIKKIDILNIIKSALYKKGRGILNDYLNGEIGGDTVFGIKAEDGGSRVIYVTCELKKTEGGININIDDLSVENKGDPAPTGWIYSYDIGTAIF